MYKRNKYNKYIKCNKAIYLLFVAFILYVKYHIFGVVIKIPFMKSFKFILIVVVSLLFIQCSNIDKSEHIKLLRTNVNKLSIRAYGRLFVDAWNVNPQLKPDIFKCGGLGNKVTFYSDIDSISCILTEDTEFNFGVLVGKDTAFTQIKYRASHLDILRKADKYNERDTTKIPEFVYQDSSNEHLVALRKRFNLDSIAGKGNEISKIIHLMHWMHDIVPHDGHHMNPDDMNAVDMIRICKRDMRGLNCRGLAVALNECYLAMGFKSRYVTCMPKDSVFNDCHVINMVYSNDLQKWVWMDPTQDAYVMDENGEILGLKEVRERLITGKPLILNPDANWNKRVSATREYYLYKYMAKNLYRLEVPLCSEYNYETSRYNSNRVFVQLLPLDGLCQFPKYGKRIWKDSIGSTFVFKTNNPDLFYARP